MELSPSTGITPIVFSPNYRQELLRRLELNDKLSRSNKLLEMALYGYANDCIRWIEDFCITVDPRNNEEDEDNTKTRKMPFLLFPRQKEMVQFILECLQEKEHGLIEKSRDMGATWLCCAISVWLWLFRPGITIGWGSLLAHNIDDRGNPKSIFLKIRQIIDHLPPFMKPMGYDPRWHAPSMKVLHPSQTWGSAIIGEGGDNMGRGGRTTIYFKDESAHYEHPDLIEAALGDNTNVQIDISSVNGSANVFYRRRMAGEVWYPGCKIAPGTVRVFVLDWSDHPNKSKEWHDRREATSRREGLLHIFRQEVDRDYAGSIDKIIIQQEWVRAAVDAHIVLDIHDDGERVAGQDIADGGTDKNASVGRHGIITRFAEDWHGDADEAPKVAIPMCVRQGIYCIEYDSVGVGTGFKATINQMTRDGTLPDNMLIEPWNGGAEVMDPDKPSIPGDDQSPTNKNQYRNLKAQSWFRVRARFYKTYRAVKFGDKYPHAELISLDSTMPKLHELMMQLSQATYDSDQKGKTIVDKKPDGTISPNLADGLIMCYNPIRKPAGFFYS